VVLISSLSCWILSAKNNIIYAPKISDFKAGYENTLLQNKPTTDDIIALQAGLKGYLAEKCAKYGNEFSELLSKLANCESGFKNICIVDTNEKLSCGIFMFQKATFYGNCEGKWLNPFDQIDCAIKLIENGKLKVHWVNCSKKIL